MPPGKHQHPGRIDHGVSGWIDSRGYQHDLLAFDQYVGQCHRRRTDHLAASNQRSHRLLLHACRTFARRCPCDKSTPCPKVCVPPGMVAVVVPC